MARTYMVAVGLKEKGKVERTVMYETLGKGENDARTRCLYAAAEEAPDGAQCSVLCVSRLKKGVPVKPEMFGYKTDEIHVVTKDYKIKSVPTTQAAYDKIVNPACTDTSTTKAVAVPIKAPPGKPKLHNMVSDEMVAAMSTKNTWIAYDSDNKEIAYNGDTK